MPMPEGSVFVMNIDADETMRIVRELRQQGLVQGKDFDFRYQQAEYNYYGDEQQKPRGAEFYFYQGKWATYFTLKYAK